MYRTHSRTTVMHESLSFPVQTLFTDVSSGRWDTVDHQLMGITGNSVADAPDVEQKVAGSEDDQYTEHVKPVSFLSLFLGADAWDILAISIGIVGALINGAAFPMFAFVFGEVRFSTLSSTCTEIHHILRVFTCLLCLVLVFSSSPCRSSMH